MRRIFQWLIRIVLIGSIFIALLIIGIVLTLYPTIQQMDLQIQKIVRDHQDLKASHLGWSFPGVLYSAPAPLSLPKDHRIAHARIRNYTAQCPATDAGSYCVKDGSVIPRGGVFPEGIQPAGLKGWTRDLAMEPLELGPLIGPDAEIRYHLPLENTPPHLIAALLHSEDADFYKHSGVNFLAFARAVVANLQGRGYAQGASTITMQVVRNLTQDKEKNIKRKLREVAFSLLMERHFSKDEILQLYLDMPYLGQDGSFSICGFAAASLFYFQKDVTDITINEAAILVGILPAPATYRPDRFPARAQKKRDRVLHLLKKTGWNVSNALASSIPIASVSPLSKFRFPAFAQASLYWLEEHLETQTLYATGLKVFTSVDVVLQDRTEKIFADKLSFFMKELQLPTDPGMQGAAVLIDPHSGYLKAIYGGDIQSPYDFSRATQARRQAGSSFKPLVYALALSQRNGDGSHQWNAFDTVPNQRRTFANTNGWRPRNNGGKYSVTSTLAKGLARSENIATASLLESIGGPTKLIEFADGLGFKTENYPVEMGLALGQAEVTPLEMGTFIAMLANGGNQVYGQPVTHAIDKNGENHIYVTGLGGRILDAETAALTRDIMRLVILQGTGGASRGSLGQRGFKGNAFGKTGTTDQNKDLWFVGSSTMLSGALWLGYDTPLNMKGSSSDLAAPLWGWWMHAMHQDLNVPKKFTGLTTKAKYVCGVSGKYRNGTCTTMPIPTVSGQKPRGRCTENHPAPDLNKTYNSVWQRRGLQ